MRMSILEFGKLRLREGKNPSVMELNQVQASFCQSQPEFHLQSSCLNLRDKRVFKNCPQIFGKQALKNWEATI